jgi:hypothetical protein
MEHINLDLEESRPQPKPLDGAWVADRIRLVFSAYRKDEWSDPEGFVVQLGMNLERFPKEVIEHVTDPRTGIQTRNKWPPSLAEFIEACWAELDHRKKVAKYTAFPTVEKLPAPRCSVTESYTYLTAKHGRPHGVFEDGRELVYKG